MGKKSLILLCVFSWLVTLVSLSYVVWRERGARQFTLNKDVPQLVSEMNDTLRDKMPQLMSSESNMPPEDVPQLVGSKIYTLRIGVPQLMGGGSYTLCYQGIYKPEPEADPNEEEPRREEEVDKFLWGEANFLLQSGKYVEERTRTGHWIFGPYDHTAPITLYAGKYTKFHVGGKK